MGREKCSTSMERCYQHANRLYCHSHRITSCNHRYLDIRTFYTTPKLFHDLSSIAGMVEIETRGCGKLCISGTRSMHAEFCYLFPYPAKCTCQLLYLHQYVTKPLHFFSATTTDTICNYWMKWSHATSHHASIRLRCGDYFWPVDLPTRALRKNTYISTTKHPNAFNLLSAAQYDSIDWRYVKQIQWVRCNKF